MKTILVYDHDSTRSHEVCTHLIKEDINVFRMSSLFQCEVEARRLKPSALVIEVRPDGASPQEVMSLLRSITAAPIIIVSSHFSEELEMEALKHGARDYLRGAPSGALIAARILNLLRSEPPVANETATASSRIFRRGDLIISEETFSISLNGHAVDLTKKEMQVFLALAQRPGVVKSREALIEDVNGANVYVEERSVDSHVKRLRRKLKQLDPSFAYIQTIYGVGYRFCTPSGNDRSDQPCAKVHSADTAGGSKLMCSKSTLYSNQSAEAFY